MYRQLCFSGITACLLAGVFAFFLFDAPAQGAAFTADREQIEKILGPGELKNGFLIIELPRHDLQPKMQGESVPEALASTSRIMWRRIGREIMVVGRLVLLEKEVDTVITELESIKIETTAVHAMTFSDEPRLMHLQIYGVGNPETMAQGIRQALAETGVMKGPKEPLAAVSNPRLDTKGIEKVIGIHGRSEGGVFKIRVGRKGVSLLRFRISPEMGVSSWAAFYGTSERAHLAGEISLTATEVNSVVRTLRRNGMKILGLNHKFLDEEPRIFFVQFWGSGPALSLAGALREAVDIIRGAGRTGSDITSE